MDVITWAVAALGIFTASFFATVSGFGFALVAMPILSLALPVRTVIIFNIALTVVLRILTMYRVRRDFEKDTVALISVGSFLGAAPGSFLLKAVPVTGLKIFLGAVLLLAVFLMSNSYTVRIGNKTVGRLGAGFLTGFFGTSTSISGPPLVLYFLNEHIDKRVMRADMIWIFGLSGFVGLVASYLAGNLESVSEWPLLWAMLPAMALGIFLGERLFFRLSQSLFRRLALLIVCAGGAFLLASGLRDVFAA